MFELISRNRKVYTRDRLAFFMSFLSVIILILVYQVFLGQIQIDAIKEALGSDTASSDTIKMVNYWLISGLTTIISMTSTLGAFGVMVSDKEKKLSEDFKVSPIPNFKVELSYAIFAILFGIILTMFSCVFAIGIFNGFSSLLDYSAMDYLKIFVSYYCSSCISLYSNKFSFYHFEYDRRYLYRIYFRSLSFYRIGWGNFAAGYDLVSYDTSECTFKTSFHERLNCSSI